MGGSPHTDLDEWLAALFDSVDRQDTAGFVEFLTPDARFRFASAPVVVGAPAIAAAVDAFFASISGSRHRVVERWRQDETVVCRGEVVYRRHDGSEAELPFANFLYLRGDRIAGHHIYADLAPLFAAG